TTAMVKNIHPTGSSLPRSFAPLSGGRVLFAADDGVTGSELWVSDGTAGGTTLVKDIWPGAVGSVPSGPAALGGPPRPFPAGGARVLFAAGDSSNGRELWVSDGTTAGTTLVANLRPGAASSAPAMITPVAGGAYFTADDGTSGRELWRVSAALVPTLVKDVW